MKNICYSCGKEAKFKVSLNRWCCEKSARMCIEVKRKNSIHASKCHKSGKIPGWNKLDKLGIGNRNWSKGLTKDSDIRIAKISKGVKLHIKLYGSSQLGRHHTEETKSKLSTIRCEYLENHDSQCKWYDVSNGIKNIKVQGTWEKRFAEYLNLNNIKWDRFKLKFKNYHRYTPDFYLTDLNIFVEIKGWMRDRDKYKMWSVLDEHNIDIRLIDSLDLIFKLNNKLISIYNLDKFNIKYPKTSIDFSKFKKTY